MKNFHDLGDHGFMVSVEAPHVITAKRIRDSIHQTPVAEWSDGLSGSSLP